MAIGYTRVPNSTVLPEQVLSYFGITIDDSNKCLCPFHQETLPSMQVNRDYVYCYGCKWAGDVWKLALELLKLNGNSDANIPRFLNTTAFPSPSGRTYRESGYRGSVEQNLIDYWHSCLIHNAEAYITLIHERGFSGDTIQKFKLGWRPDKKAYVIPFIYRDKVDIVQFRATNTDDSGKKYWGLEGHNRGSLVNRDILDHPLSYVVVLMGAFDPILADQCGIPAVGMNGSFPFKQTEKTRVQDMFAKQTIKFIVPDNNPEEIKAAHKLAEWIDGDVRLFPESTPHNTDFINYILDLGKTADDFKREVLGILPYDNITGSQLYLNLCSLYDVGDKQALANFHANWYANGTSYADLAIAMAGHVTSSQEKRMFYNVQNKAMFEKAMQNGYTMQGGW